MGVEKIFGEEDLKGLDAEIDEAVEKLFIDKRKGLAETAFSDAPAPEPSKVPSSPGPPRPGPPRPGPPSPMPPSLEASHELEQSLELKDLLEKAPGPAVKADFPEPSPELEETIDLKSVLEGVAAPEAVQRPSEPEPPRESEPILEATLGLAERPPLGTTAKGPALQPLPDFEETIALSGLKAEPPRVEPPSLIETPLGFGAPPPLPVASTPHRALERLETQLLSLEWEITKQNLNRTMEEVAAFRATMKERREVSSVSASMEKLLNQMIGDEEAIRPALIRLLLDSKETIRLLLREGPDRPIDLDQQLAYEGIQARFALLDEAKESAVKPQPVPVAPPQAAVEGPEPRAEQTDEILRSIDALSKRVDEMTARLDQRLARLEGEIRKGLARGDGPKPLPVSVTVLKVDERLFGVETQKILRLFKLPRALGDKYASRDRVRLKDQDVRMIDLRRLFDLPGHGRKVEVKILTVRENGECKALLVDEILKKLSGHVKIGEGAGEYFSGSIHWTYQDRPVVIPILDLRKL